MNGIIFMKQYVVPWHKQVLFGQRVGCDVRLVECEATHRGLGVRVVLENHKEM